MHDVIVPAVGKLPVLPAHVEAAEVDLVRLAVFELNELAQARQELRVPVGAMLVGQDGQLIVALGEEERRGRKTVAFGALAWRGFLWVAPARRGSQI